ncbi:MAG TPA: aspartate/glutamate racemase family protein [Amaricoccus sp.]|nr:aspartate/glutamate racemase family protein [Amaricoccus sp.]
MRLLVVNPNTTASMTGKIGAAARRAASPGTEITAVNPTTGPVSIEGYYDEAISVPGLLEIVRTTPADAVVVACFDDTGLDAARCLTAAPVIGIGEAGFHFASVLSNKFSVVTTLSRSVPAIEHNLHRYGLAHRCARVRASDVPVLDLEKGDAHSRAKIAREIRLAIEEDRAEAIVLGCAGMTDLAASFAEEFALPVLDGVACAVAMAEAIARIGLETSRRGGYAPPITKPVA